MPVQIEELKLPHAKEMSALRADLNEIKTALLADSKPRAHWGDFDNKKNTTEWGIGSEAMRLFKEIKKDVRNVN